ncbi:hypothetical protein WMO79_01035 [Micrococcaceae bacterium Sec7.4]
MPDKTLRELQPGDKVVVKRNLDHPAWMKQVAADPRNGSSTKWVRDTSVEEVISGAIVTERRENPARIQVSINSFWYLLADGKQMGSKSTLVQPR